MSDKKKTRVVMGRMHGPDGEPLPPEVEEKVWSHVAREVDQAIIRNMPRELLVVLGRMSEDERREVWPIIRRVRLGLMTAEEFEAELDRLKK